MTKKVDYKVFEALNPFFKLALRGLSGLVDGEHYFETFAEDAIFESRYRFPGWPVTIHGRANLMASLSGYGKTIKLHSGDALEPLDLDLRRDVDDDHQVEVGWPGAFGEQRDVVHDHRVGAACLDGGLFGGADVLVDERVDDGVEPGERGLVTEDDGR